MIEGMIGGRFFRGLRRRKHHGQDRGRQRMAHRSWPEFLQHRKHVNQMDLPERKKQQYSPTKCGARACPAADGMHPPFTSLSPARSQTFAGILPPPAQSAGTPHPRARPPAADRTATPGARNNSQPRPYAETRRQSASRRKPPAARPGNTSALNPALAIIQSVPTRPGGGPPFPGLCSGKPAAAPASTWSSASSPPRPARLPASFPAASAPKPSPRSTNPSPHPLADTPWPASSFPAQEKQRSRNASCNFSNRWPAPCRTRFAPHPATRHSATHTRASNARMHYRGASAPVPARPDTPCPDFPSLLRWWPEIQLPPPVPAPAKEPAGRPYSSADIPPPRRPNKSHRSNAAVPALPMPARTLRPSPPPAPASRSLPYWLLPRAASPP